MCCYTPPRHGLADSACHIIPRMLRPRFLSEMLTT